MRKVYLLYVITEKMINVLLGLFNLKKMLMIKLKKLFIMKMPLRKNL